MYKESSRQQFCCAECCSCACLCVCAVVVFFILLACVNGGSVVYTQVLSLFGRVCWLYMVYLRSLLHSVDYYTGCCCSRTHLQTAAVVFNNAMVPTGAVLCWCTLRSYPIYIEVLIQHQPFGTTGRRRRCSLSRTFSIIMRFHTYDMIYMYVQQRSTAVRTPHMIYRRGPAVLL